MSNSPRTRFVYLALRAAPRRHRAARRARAGRCARAAEAGQRRHQGGERRADEVAALPGQAVPWRSIYLQGAYELRNGVPTAGGTQVASPDTIRAMSPEMLFDYFGVRLNGPKAAGKNMSISVDFTVIFTSE